MIVIDDSRPSDSPLVKRISRGHTLTAGSVMRPAESHWHMVLSKRSGATELLLVGPWSSSGPVTFGPDEEVLWIRFEMGVYMPHLLTRRLLNLEIPVPEAASNKFWLKGSGTWQFPDYENVDTFVNRLIHDELLTMDQTVREALNGAQPDISPRTLRHRFLQTTGMSQTQVFQVQRAWQAEALLRQGIPILDVVEQVGYSDQPHLTRSLKQLVGYTPSQVFLQPAPV